MINHWSAEVWRFLLLELLALLLGWLAGHVLLALWLVTLAYLVWHLRNLRRLEKYLSRMKNFQPPQASGIWAEIFYQLYRQQERYRSRKRRLTGFLNRFQNLIKAMPDATVVLNHSGEIEWFNAAAEQLLGLRSPQDRGQRIENLIRYPAFYSYLQRGDYAEPIVLLSPAHEAIRLAIIIVPYSEQQQLLVARDVTQVQRLEEMRRDFVANVSHELRTPLTVINGMLENIQGLTAGQAQFRTLQRPVELMEEQARRMTNIVQDLLLLSRLDAGHIVKGAAAVDVPQMLQVLGKEARTLSGERRHAISLEVDDSLWLSGDSEQLRSAFINLISNAIRYTPAEGSIRIRWYRDAAGACFEVSDSGIGIAEHHLPRLTERFYRVDIGRSKTSGGTGLGLAIVKHVLELHEGRLAITSRLGEGSTFSCHFNQARMIDHL